MKTGLDAWAEAHGSTAAEVEILLKAEGRDPELFLGDAIKTETPIPNGRDGALTLLLGRGRTGSISVGSSVIADVTGKVIDEAMVRSDSLPGILGMDISDGDKRDEGQVLSVMTEKPAKKDEAPKKTESARRKTKYSMGKAAADEMLKSKSGEPPVRAIRMFFLSLPEYKAQDIAVMSDEEAQAEFSKNYVCISVETGCVILSRKGRDAIRDVLGGGDGYFIPGA